MNYTDYLSTLIFISFCQFKRFCEDITKNGVQPNLARLSSSNHFFNFLKIFVFKQPSLGSMPYRAGEWQVLRERNLSPILVTVRR